jgi:hypothetical protein
MEVIEILITSRFEANKDKQTSADSSTQARLDLQQTTIDLQLCKARTIRAQGTITRIKMRVVVRAS